MSVASWIACLLWCGLYLFAPVRGAPIELSSSPALFVKGTILAATDDPQTMASSGLFKKGLVETIEKLSGVNQSFIKARGACLVGCSSTKITTGLEGNSTDLADVTGVVGFLFVINVSGSTHNESDAAVLRRFAGLGSFQLEELFDRHNAVLNDTVLVTREETGIYERNPISTKTINMRILDTIEQYFSRKSPDEVCYWMTLQTQMRDDYLGTLEKAVRVTGDAGGNSAHKATCRRKAVSLLRLTCMDGDNDGATDSWGSGCYFYSMNGIDACGKYDDADFVAGQRCCACGKGGNRVSTSVRTPSAGYCSDLGLPTDVDSFNLGCASYALAISSGGGSNCGQRDTAAFQANVKCCACGGGNVSVHVDIGGGGASVVKSWAYMKIQLDMSEAKIKLTDNMIDSSLWDTSPTAQAVDDLEASATSTLASYLRCPKIAVISHYVPSTKTLLAVSQGCQGRSVNLLAVDMEKIPSDGNEWLQWFRGNLTLVDRANTIKIKGFYSAIHTRNLR